MKPIHEYRTTEWRVIAGGYPIVSECGHVNGTAFGRVTRKADALRDSPSHNAIERVPAGHPAFEAHDLVRLGLVIHGGAGMIRDA